MTKNKPYKTFSTVRVITRVIFVTKCTTAQQSMFVSHLLRVFSATFEKFSVIPL